MKQRLRTAFRLFMGGALLGPAGDYCHLISGTTAYPEGGLKIGILPWWVPPVFGAAAVAIGFFHLGMDRLLPPSRIRPPSLALSLAGVLAFLGMYCLSGFLPWETGGLNDVVLAFIALGFWVLLDRTWPGALLAAVTAAAGTLVEISLVRDGAFSYTHGNLYGVASWLPWLYFAAAVATGNLARAVKARA